MCVKLQTMKNLTSIKSSRLLNNCEKKVNETPDNKHHKNNVCINPPPVIENRISSIPDITDNKTSTNRNTSTKTSNQRENRNHRKF